MATLLPQENKQATTGPAAHLLTGEEAASDLGISFIGIAIYSTLFCLSVFCPSSSQTFRLFSFQLF